MAVFGFRCKFRVIRNSSVIPVRSQCNSSAIPVWSQCDLNVIPVQLQVIPVRCQCDTSDGSEVRVQYDRDLREVFLVPVRWCFKMLNTGGAGAMSNKKCAMQNRWWPYLLLSLHPYNISSLTLWLRPLAISLAAHPTAVSWVLAGVTTLQSSQLVAWMYVVATVLLVRRHQPYLCKSGLTQGCQHFGWLSVNYWFN